MTGEMTGEVVRALLLAGVPVTAFTFLIIQWSVSTGRMERLSGDGDLEEQHRRLTKTRKQSTRQRREEALEPPSMGRFLADVVHGKLVSFGGGYYGTMAVLTYILIESVEIWQFLGSLLDLDVWMSRLGVDLVVDFFINTLTNIIAAFIWFATLPDYFRINNGWVWLAVTYGAYHLGLQISARAGDRIWSGLGSLVQRRSPGPH